MKKIALLITCEHAVDTVPQQYESLFTNFKDLLATHRGIDFGALAIARHLQATLPCDFVQAFATRLLIDCNRSINHPGCFSEVTRHLTDDEKRTIIQQYYTPFRSQVIDVIQQYQKQHIQVLHLSIHSFTPIFNDIPRRTDIGLLYNPQRVSEKKLCEQWKTVIHVLNPAIRVRKNYPYKGISDGFTSALRKLFSDDQYIGIEVESNQALTTNDKSLGDLKKILADSLLNIIH